MDNNQLHGCDIDNEAISWCQSNLQHIGEFSTNKPLPNLPYEDDYFDIVYSISVFTHLPEDMQFEWLNELKRVTRKGGYLLLTTHGEHLAPKRVQKTMQKHGFHYSVGDRTDGLPDFYQTTFHTDQYIKDHWQAYFDIIKIVKKGVHNHQDLVICRNVLD
jgi:ubiquinone/menaquinone biosynthesis C-methylase UbiE